MTIADIIARLLARRDFEADNGWTDVAERLALRAEQLDSASRHGTFAEVERAKARALLALANPEGYAKEVDP